MRCYLSLWALLIYLISISCSAADRIQPLQPLTDLPEGIRITSYAEHIRTAYGYLVNVQNEKVTGTNIISLYHMISLIEGLEISLNQVFRLPCKLDPHTKGSIMLTLESLFQKITEFLDQSFLKKRENLGIKNKMENLFSNVLTESTDLTRFIKMISDQKVVVGAAAQKEIPPRFLPTVRACLGRIFVVQDSIVKNYSSGMIIPREEHKIIIYDQIVTCAHSMMPEEKDPGLEFYFVRAECLDPMTGLPSPEEIGRTLEMAVEQTHTIGNLKLAIYLKKKCTMKQDEVRRITHFTGFSLPSCRTISTLSDHSPRYNLYQDNGFGHLESRFNLPDNLAQIVLSHQIPEGNYTYYAIGYPTFKHIDTTEEHKLVQEMKFSPLTTSWNRMNELDDPHPLKLKDERIQHGATTVPGMSGGPVVVFNETDGILNILGVVSVGDMDHDYMCKFW